MPGRPLNIDIKRQAKTNKSNKLIEKPSDSIYNLQLEGQHHSKQIPGHVDDAVFCIEKSKLSESK